MLAPRSGPRWLPPVLAIVTLTMLAAGVWMLVEGLRTDPAVPGNSPVSDSSSGSVDQGTETPPDAMESGPLLDRSPLERPAPVEEPSGPRIHMRGKVVSAVDGSPLGDLTVEVFAKPAPRTLFDLRQQMQNELGGSAVASVHDLQALDVQNNSWKREDVDGSPGNDQARSANRDSAPTPPIASADTDSAGEFAIDLPSELSTAFFRVRGAFLPDAASSPVEETRFIVLRAMPSATITGTVRHEDGSPAPDAHVGIEGNFDPFEFVSGSGGMMVGDEIDVDESGRFEIDSIGTGRSVVLVATEQPYAPVTETVEIRTPRRHEIELVLRERTTLRVSVVTRAGQPVESAGVFLMPAQLDLSKMGTLSRTVPDSLRTDAEGRVEVEGLPLGRWVLDVSKAGWLSPDPVTVELTGPRAEEIEIRLDAGRTLTGRVLDQDGVPVQNAKLRCVRPPSLTNLSSLAAGPRQPWLSVQGDGSFELSGLREETLTLEVRALGYRALDQKIGTADVQLDLRMEKLGVIQGLALGKANGAPIADFWVEPQREQSFSLDLSDLLKTQWIRPRLRFHSEDGKFRIEGVEPGRWKLTVGAEGFAPFTTETIDLHVAETSRRMICVLLRESCIEGRVLDSTSRTAVEGARIQVGQGAGNPMTAALATFQKSENARSDENGLFRITGLAAGRYSLEVTHDDYAKLSRSGFEVADQAELSGVELLLLAGGTVFGEVRASGVPTVGSRIFAATAAGQIGGSATSDEQGRYRIEGLAAGHYVLTHMPGSFSFDSENLLSQFQDGFETHEVDLQGGEELRVDFGGRTLGSASLKGRVMQSGSGFSGALVTLMSGDESLQITGSGARTSISSDTGAFEFTGLTAGPVLVQCQVMDRVGALPSRILWHQARVDEHRTTEVRFELAAGEIAGRVIDAGDGTPLAGVQVRAVSAAPSAHAPAWQGFSEQYGATTSSDADGHFLLRRIDAGPYFVVAGGRDLLGLAEARAETRSAVVEVGASRAEVGDLRVGSGGSVEGEVLDGEGNPVAGATVTLRTSNGQWLHPFSLVITGASGEFSYGGLPDGVFDVVARAPGKAQAEREGVEVHSGSRTKIQALRLLGGTAVYFDLTGLDASAVDRLQVAVFGPTGRLLSGSYGLADLQSLLRPGSEGRQYLGTFPAGTYRMRGSTGSDAFEREFVLAGEKERVLTLDS